MNNELLIRIAIIFVVTVASGIIVAVRRWSDDSLHYMISFGAGIFLGIVFLHLLPETLQQDLFISGPFLLAGFLLLFFLKRFLLARRSEAANEGHEVIGITAFIGMSVHSVIDGLGLAAALNNSIGNLFFYSILAHKVPAALALGCLLMLARFRAGKIIMMLLFFGSITPLAVLLFSYVFIDLDASFLTGLTAIVSGSFLYVATAELLPEVFHITERRWVNLALLLSGITLSGWIVPLIAH